MAKANLGDSVKVHYTGKLKDGTVFDSSPQNEPLSFIVGEGKFMTKFEEAIVGMEPGESTSVNIPAEEAYGKYNKKLVYEIRKEKLPKGFKPETGKYLQSVQKDGRKIMLEVTKVAEETVTLDANHPLAGKDLSYEIKLIEIS